MNRSLQIEIPREAIAAFSRRHGIRKLCFFGSVLRDDFQPESDVDVLVEFETNLAVGLIAFAGMELELSEILGRKVDMRTPAELSRYFRNEVLAEAVEQYVQT
jgi:predicted nucleotidyltransferase